MLYVVVYSVKLRKLLEIIQLNKTYNCHKPVLATKLDLGQSEMLTSGLAYKNTSSLQHFIESVFLSRCSYTIVIEMWIFMCNFYF